MTRRTRLALLAIAALGTGSVAETRYVARHFYDLAGLSDVVVLGEIVAVRAKTFELRAEELLAGSATAENLTITRFVDWTCSHRWKPYAVGQHEVAFLEKLPERQARQTGARCFLRSAGAEGEWEVRGGRIFVPTYRIPGGALHDEGSHPGQWLPLRDVVDALRGYRECFSVTAGPPVSGGWARDDVQVVCQASALQAYRERSIVHEYLVKTSLEAASK